MHQFQNILVGVDLSYGDRLASAELSPATKEAIARAKWLANRSQARMTLVAVLDVSAHTQELLHNEFAGESRNLESEANEILQSIVADLRESNIEADYSIQFGTPWKEIIQLAISQKSDLVIIGTRDLGFAGRVLFGSTALKLARYCPTAVWVARPDQNWSDMNLLIATDLGDLARDLIQVGVGLGQLAEGTVHVLHVVQHELDQRMLNTGINPDQLQKYHDEEREQAEHQIHEILSMTDYRTIEKGVMVDVIEGFPESAIHTHVEQNKIDLVVMGTVGRGGLSGFFIGNTAERLLQDLQTSLLILKPDDFVCPIT